MCALRLQARVRNGSKSSRGSVWRSKPWKCTTKLFKPRPKVMGRFLGEDSCLTVVWAMIDLRITHQINSLRFNQLDSQRLKRMRYELSDPASPEEVAGRLD